MTDETPRAGVLAASPSELSTMRQAGLILEKFGVEHEIRIMSSSRNPDLVDEYAPNFKSSVLDRQVLAPPDLERVFNITGGNIFQGAMTPGQLFAFRPVPGHARYRTPVAGLYLCGAAAHPGGGVMGTPGLNAAREILGKRRLRASA